MNQQLYDPQSQTSGFGQQGQLAQQMDPHQQMGQQGQFFSQALPPQAIQAVTGLERIETIGEFVKARAVQQGMPHVPRVADDLKNIAEVQKDLIVRQSEHAQTLGQCTQQVFQQSLQQLQQYQQQLPEIQELVMEVQQSQQVVQQAVQQLPTSTRGGSGQQGYQGPSAPQQWPQ